MGSTRVVVVGAGIIGLAAARELAARGADVVVVERHLAGAGTSSRGEGNLLVSDKEIPAEAALALRSLALWAQLAESSPEPFEYEPKGGIITASSDAQLVLLRAQADLQAGLGITSEVLDAAALRTAEPQLSHALVGGIRFPQDAQVMPIHAVRALLRAARDLGVVERVGVEPTGLQQRTAGVRLDLSDGTHLDADAVVLATGPWSGALADRLGGVAPVFPRRGLLLVTEPLPAGTVRHKVYDGRYVEAVASDDAAAKVAPVIESTQAGTVLIGSTREAVGWATDVPWDLAGRLAGEAARLFPALGLAEVIRLYQGFRPATPDHLPLIGPDVRVSGLWHCSGHEGAGIGLAPGSAEVLADAILDDQVDPAFDPRRDAVASASSSADLAPTLRPFALAAGGAGSGADRVDPVDPAGRPAPAARAGGAPSTVAAAHLFDDAVAWRRTRFADRPRGLWCGIGQCHDCVLPDAEGRTVRACLAPGSAADPCIPAPAGERPAGPDDGGGDAVDVDVVVIGAGPGGLAAAADLADAGAGPGGAGLAVAVVDRHDTAGGQIGRQPAPGAGPATTSRPTGPWADLIVTGTATATHLAGTAVVAARRHPGGRRRFELLLRTDRGLRTATADHVVLAAGGREVVAPFPGWTLPGVLTAGALQALVKREGRSPFDRVVLAGTGPLLLAVADAVAAAGTRPLAVLERTSAWGLRGGLPAVVAHPDKAVAFGRLALRARPRYGWRVVEAVGDERLQAVVLADRRGRTRTTAVDALAVSDGLVPDAGLAVQLGCATVRRDGTAGPAVVVDDRQATDVEGVWAVGELTGVGGADKAVAEGRLAAAAIRASAGGPAVTSAQRADVSGWRAFADALAVVHPWPAAAVAALPDAEVVCRCEEVTAGAVRSAMADGATTSRAVKGLTRCGMGRCQGAVCGPLVGSLLAQDGHDDPGDLEHRPLAAPVPIDQLARLAPADG